MFQVPGKSLPTRGKSVSTKISLSVMIILIPSFLLLILISCIMAANSIANLNDKILDAQTDYAVSTVDGFFENKLTAVSMFERDSGMQAYFTAVYTPQDINIYPGKAVLVDQLTSALERMSDQNVQQAWVADVRTDTYLLSTGETVTAGFASTTWDDDIIASKAPMVTEPFIDPATNENIVSIVSPVFDISGTTVIGFVGFDIFIDSLAQSLNKIQIGKEGYLELLSNSSDYIYSADDTAIGNNVTDLEISDSYINNVLNDYEGIMDFSYGGVSYTSLSRICNTTGWLAIATLPTAEINETRNQLLAVMVIVSVIILILLVCIIIMLIRRAINPLITISKKVEEFAQGNLNVDIQTKGDDEIGHLANSVRFAIQTLRDIVSDISRVLSEISSGNLCVTVDGNYMGDLQPIREALEHIIQSLSQTMGRINQASEQVSAGSDQVSAGAQVLSQGTTEQASSIEELASTITELSGQISTTAQNATEASDRMNAVGNEAEESNRRMQTMLEAIGEIKSSANEIGKIIKTIEDIAFQTNILALNAAVEAARAGVAGKGFAVVADEVRSLANKSQEASKNTAILIENALRAVEHGTGIADKTAHSLEVVVEGVSGVRETIGSISTASNEQAEATSQVTQGLDQISSVVQTNSATAEESAAASEELSSQAQVLKDLVSQFRLKTDNAPQ